MATQLDFSALLQKSQRVFELASSLSTSYGFYKEDLANGKSEQDAVQAFDESMNIIVAPDFGFAPNFLPENVENVARIELFQEKGMSLRDITKLEQQELYDLIVGLRESIQAPPFGFETVAPLLHRAAKIVKQVQVHGTAAIYDELTDELSSIAGEGLPTVALLRYLIKPADPFAFLSGHELTNTANCPDSFQGHVQFIERFASKLGDLVKSHKTVSDDVVSNRLEFDSTILQEWEEVKLRFGLMEELPDNIRSHLGLSVHLRIDVGIHDEIHNRLFAAINEIKLWWSGIGREQTVLSISNHLCAGASIETPTKPSNVAIDNPPDLPGTRKRSTGKGEARAKIVAAFTFHHNYGQEGPLKLEPIGNNELAELADVDKSTTSAFFREHFEDHKKYKIRCLDEKYMLYFLKLINGEITGRNLSFDPSSTDR